MQMCPFCDHVYDESEYSHCPYCSGELNEDDDDDEPYGTYRRGGRMGRSSYGRRREYDREYDERDYEKERMFPYEDELKRGRSVRYIRY
mgnify:CR=1 FL=1